MNPTQCAAISSRGCLSSQVSPNSYSAGWAIEGYAKATLHCVIVLILFVVITFISVRSSSSKLDDRDPDSLLKSADSLSWNNNWIRAEPLYYRAELLYAQQHRPSRALYAHVSQIPPNAESSSLTATIFGLTEDLARSEAADPETRLRILTIRGMLEVNYDAASARSTWTQVAELARHLNHFELASRAVGEQGISAFILGDIGAAKKDMLEAWTLAKVLHDPAASVRYASVYGAGLVELHRYKEALTPLDEAIKITTTHPEVAYPTIAVNSKIDALRGLQQYNEALALSRDALAHLPNASLKGHEFQILMSRAEIYEDLNQWDLAIADYLIDGLLSGNEKGLPPNQEYSPTPSGSFSVDIAKSFCLWELPIPKRVHQLRLIVIPDESRPLFTGDPHGNAVNAKLKAISIVHVFEYDKDPDKELHITPRDQPPVPFDYTPD
jgi:tetratricopeptide (TPR) repeat protein